MLIPLIDRRSPLTVVAFRFGEPTTIINVAGPMSLDRRVYHSLPQGVGSKTRHLAEQRAFSLSRTALFLQIIGLAWIVKGVGWRTLFRWRHHRGNPRAPYNLGIPQPWLDALTKGVSADLLPEHVFRQDVSPVIYPPTERMLYSQPSLWHQIVQEAARSLMVPASHLLGLLQTAGLLAYHIGLPPARNIFATDGPRDELPGWLSTASLVLGHVINGQNEEARQTAEKMIEESINK